MENELEIKRVPFMGAELMAARDTDGQIWAGVRWMCDGIGLSKGQMQNERTRIHNDKVLSQGERNLVLPTRGGNQETLCLKLDFVPLWLAKISITPSMEDETPELADRLEQYQLRAKDTLAEAFLPAAANPNFTSLSPELQMFKAIFDSVAKTELKQKEQDKAIEAVNQKVDGIRDVVVLNPNSWREECRRLLAKVAQARGGGGAYQEVNAEVFQLVDERARVSLETRLTNKRRRMADEGVCKSKRDKLNKVDVIADDAKLIEIYIAIVKEMAVKYGVTIGKEV
ncbi:phage antirepressor N-terminal domain-containing protein [Flavonifractor plautii]|uniref:phage antirepressor N-terminal domain-containing protein n=1 Tax=Flavonifractor plautii TaxID=292800 RepID=UPI001D028486|nr:phage antirepressor N-terminal domain-containing protein [Flavonifractor plautii]MCB5374194.1 phage antirepressor N-terminal domain-containing protein [Flavonifractor plautii]